MYTSRIAIVGITSFIVQLFTKVHYHCKESECDCSCYDKIKQILFYPLRSMSPSHRFGRSETLSIPTPAR